MEHFSGCQPAIHGPWPWRWNWEHSVCLRAAFIDVLFPLLVTLTVWRLSARGRSKPLLGSGLRGSDNRVWIGPFFLLLIAVQTLVQGVVLRTRAAQHTSTSVTVLSSAAFAFSWLVVTVIAGRQLAAYLMSARHQHYGLYSHAVFAFTITNMCAAAIQAYFAFLVPSQWKTPMWGSGVSSDSLLVQVRLFINVVAAALLLVVRRLPRPESKISLPDAPADTEQLLGQDEFEGVVAPTPHRLSTDAVAMEPSPEISASILSNLMFRWTGAFIAFGDPERSQQPQVDDLFEPPHRYTMVGSCAQFRQHASADNSLFWNLVKTFKGPILLQLALNPLMAVFDFSQPMIMQRFLRFIDQHAKDTSVGLRYGLFLSFAMLGVSVFAEFTLQQQLWHSRLLNLGIRNVLVTMLTQKTMRRKTKGSGRSRSDASYGGNDSSEGRAHNVLSADLSGISKLPVLLLGIVKAPMRQIIGAWYMYRLLGLSGLLGTFILILVMLLTRKLIARAKRIEKSLGVVNDQRLASVNEVARGITSIKMSGWASRFIGIVDQKRAEQLAMLWKRAKIWSLISMITSVSSPLVIFASFVAYSWHHRLNAEVIFTAIAVFKTIQHVIGDFPKLISMGISFLVSFRRIESYLGQEEVQSLVDRTGPYAENGKLGFEDATLAWAAADDNDRNSTAGAEFTLANISLQFPSGKLTLVGGATGSGKTSLLSALIGEMELRQGSVLVPTSLAIDNELFSLSNRTVLDSVAYVSQEPWLRNATIRENILFGEPFEQQRYEAVLHMCALGPDLTALTAGDFTEIGERGITLSGGQRQRVALARALYSRRKVLLIDDCLSAVDAHTGKHIVGNCFAQTDSEVMKDRTCVLVTHHLALCMPHADFVVLMENGGVAFQGTPDEMRASPDSTMVNLFEAADDSDSDNHMDNDSVRPYTVTARPDNMVAISNGSAGGRLVKDEKRVRGSIKLDVYKMYVGACGGPWFAGICLVCIIATQFLSMFKDYYLAGKLGGDNSSRGPSGASLSLSSELWWLVVYLGFGLFSAAFSLSALLLAYTGSLKSSLALHCRLLRAIVYATPRFFDTTPIGRITSVFSRDTHVMDEDLMEISFHCLQSLLGLLITLAAVSINTTVMFAGIGLIVFAAYVRLTWLFTQAQRECKRLEQTTYAPVLSLFSEIISGSSLLRAYNSESMYMQEMRHRFSVYLAADIAIRSPRQWLGTRMSLASSAVTFSAAIFVLTRISTISSGLAGFILIYATSFNKISTTLVRKYNDFELSFACVERIHHYMQVEQEAPAKRPIDNELPASWPTCGELMVRDLVAGYTADTPVLRGLTFNIKRGEKIGVVGRTGAGKSSLSLALLRLLEASSGQVLFDGVDIARIGLDKLRQSMATIAQDPVLFNGTVRFNLDPFGDCSDELLKDALCRTMLLKTDELDNASVAAFSSLDDAIMSNGQNLSLGQRQLVALARALVRRARLVILDEATAAVDFENDSRIQHTIRGPEFKDSTLLCIAHRLRTIIDYDRILVLHDGKIVEFDTPAKLIQKAGGYFRQLCENSNEFELLQELACGSSF